MTDNASAAAIYARAKQRIEELGISDTEAGRRAGGLHLVKNLSKGRMPSVDKLPLIAAALGMRPEFLAFGIQNEDAPHALARMPALAKLRSVPIIGEVAAGEWLAADTAVDAALYEGIAIPPDPDYPIEHQFAAITRGTSANRVAPDGTILGCIDVQQTGRAPRDKELVIAQQTRKDGGEIERTAKRYLYGPNGPELWPDSDDPRWQTPLSIGRSSGDETVSVVVIGIVTWVHRRLDPSELNRPK